MRLFASVIVAGGLLAAASAQVAVNIYTGFTPAEGGFPFSGLVDTFDSPDIMFATNTSYSWHPSGLSSFGADMLGLLDVSSDGSYDFALDSDDGSRLLIDGVLVVDNGGTHAPNVVTSPASLTAGLHPFEVQFFEDLGGLSGVDLRLPAGVVYAVPEPGTFAALGAGVAMLLRRRRS